MPAPAATFTAIRATIECPEHGQQDVLLPGKDGDPAIVAGPGKCPLCRDLRDIEVLNEEIDMERRQFRLELRVCNDRVSRYRIEEYPLDIPRDQVTSWIKKQFRRWNRENPGAPRRCTMYRINGGPWLSLD